MPSKRKPVVRAWRFLSAFGRVWLLQAGHRCYWRVEGQDWRWHRKEWHDKAVACGDYSPLRPSEAKRLNAARKRAMGRKP